jgi:hypothetical protein
VTNPIEGRVTASEGRVTASQIAAASAASFFCRRM